MILNTAANTVDIMGIRNGDAGAGNMTQVRIVGNVIEFSHDFLIDTTNNKAVGGTTINSGAWFNVICQYDGTKLYVYVNGVQDGISGSLTTLALTATGTWTIATRSDFSAEWFAGKIALIRAWKGRYFSVSDIARLNTDPWRIYYKPDMYSSQGLIY